MLDSALNVDHNENYRRPPAEEGGATHKVNVFREVAHFLQDCFLCKRHLAPHTNIYMYRNFSAFCSAECRHEQIAIDKCKEKSPVEVKVRKTKDSSVGANHRQNSSANQHVQAGTVAAI